jgi:hypothetical protein
MLMPDFGLYNRAMNLAQELRSIVQNAKSPEEDGHLKSTTSGGNADSPNEKTSGAWYWRLYETTLKVLVDAVLERFWPKPK